MLKHVAVLIVGLIVSLGAVGCSSMGMGEKHAMGTSDTGVVAVTNHGSVVFLKGTNGEVQYMSSTGQAECAQCKMDAADYFKTGKLAEKCSACGAMHYSLMRGK